MHLPGKHTARQSFDVQVFDGDHRETVNDAGGQLVQHVAPAVRGLSAERRTALLGLQAPLPSPPAAGESPLSHKSSFGYMPRAFPATTGPASRTHTPTTNPP